MSYAAIQATVVNFDPIKFVAAIACGAIVLLMAFVVVITHDDWVDCQIENIKNGHFLDRDFKREVVVTSGASSKRMDFTRLEQFEKVCNIQMYTAGQPYQSSVSYLTDRPGAARACWGYAPGKLTVLGIYKNETVAWTQVTVAGSQEIRFTGPECVDRRHAILVCRENNCSFGL